MSNKVDGFMTNALWSRRMVALVASLEVCVLLGCGSRPYQVAEVDGVVLINGKPAGNLFVQFIPEVSGEASPPPSNGKTDESGHFVLNLIEPSGTMQAGAAVGSHRVVFARSASRVIECEWHIDSTARPIHDARSDAAHT